MRHDLAERRQLSDLLLELGPDAPTLCEGWTTRDMAAHLWVREHRPDVLPGLTGRGPFARWTERVQDGAAEGRDYEAMATDLRSPALLAPGRATLGRGDLHEFVVHHEDVRRANGLGARTEDVEGLQGAVWGILGAWGRVLTRRADLGITLDATGGRRRVVSRGTPAVTLAGEPVELLLALFGRADHAEVEVRGDAAAVAAWDRAEIGL